VARRALGQRPDRHWEVSVMIRNEPQKELPREGIRRAAGIVGRVKGGRAVNVRNLRGSATAFRSVFQFSLIAVLVFTFHSLGFFVVVKEKKKKEHTRNHPRTEQKTKKTKKTKTSHKPMWHNKITNRHPKNEE
jgi:hypothetical protein